MSTHIPFQISVLPRQKVKVMLPLRAGELWGAVRELTPHQARQLADMLRQAADEAESGS